MSALLRAQISHTLPCPSASASGGLEVCAILAVPARAVALTQCVRSRTALRVRNRAAVELLTVGGLLVIATLARIPQLMAIPAFTDEVEEIALGLAILRDGLRPLTNVDPYIGPLWNYTLAGLFWLLGPSIAIPRAVVLTSGVLTVLLTYLLGRVWYGRRVGLLGATLLGASAAHTAVNSHIAWSNCVTPVCTTAGLLLLARAIRDDRPRLLPAAGLLFGLAFHTHPTAAPVLVGAAVAVVVSHGRWLAGPWPYLAGLAGLAANANLLVYNVLTGGRTFRYAQEIQSSYEHEAGHSAGYVERLVDLLVGLVRALASSLEQRDSVLAYARDPLVLIAAVLTVGGLVLALRQRSWLPLLVVVASALVLPLVNPKYDPILNVRYLAPILPICLLWIGLALEWLAWGRAGESPRSVAGFRAQLDGLLTGAGGVGGVVLASGLATVLVVGSLTSLARYYDDVRENARTGARILEVVTIARMMSSPDQPVVLDERLNKMSLGPGAGIVLRVLHLTLDLEGVPTRVEWLGEARPPDVRPGQLVVLAARSKPQFTGEAVTGLGLRAINGGPARAHPQASRYGLYKFGPTPAVAAQVAATRTRMQSAVHPSQITRPGHGAVSPTPTTSPNAQPRPGRTGR